MANNLLSTVKLIEEANVVLSKHAKLLNQAAVDAEKLNKAYAKIPSKFIKAQETQLKNQTKLTASTKNLNTQTNKITTSYKQAIPSLTALVNQRKREQRLLEKTSGLYNRVQAAINKVTKKYQDLALRKQLNGKLSAKEEKQLTSLQAKLLKYNTALKKVDSQIARNQRNVGNYRSALGGLGNTFRSLAGAFGLTSGIMLFAQGIKDAFNRVREFDKEMQNMTGILRTTRPELKGIEKRIKEVAGASIKTSNEVAKLATSLFTLGKTKSEVLDLLEPVNNLAIALGTTSEESAEFLVQTLNAFGAGSEEAEKYADTIAAIRTSTSLDFQKMRDSFQYLAPISKILNKDLAYTGALIGVVADRGIKAEQAGRLLGTAQMTLASQGKTLIQGLEELNELSKDATNETEALALATQMFGKNAAKVGVTLAGAIDKIGEYEDTINSSKGALKDLTESQLESLDAKLKILDSTWEKFILSLDDGNNVLGSTLKSTISALSGSINNLGIAIEFVSNGFKTTQKNTDQVAKSIADLIPFETGLLGALKTKIKLQVEYNQKVRDYRSLVSKQIQDYVDLNGSIAPHLEQLDEMVDKYKDLGQLLGFYSEKQTEAIGTVGDLRTKIKDLNQEIEDSNTNDIEGIRIKQEKIRLLEKELEAILGVNKATREKIKSLELETTGTESLKKEIEGQILFYEKLLDLYPKGSEVAETYTKKIKNLKIALGDISAIDVSGAMKEIQASIDGGATVGAPYDPPEDTTDKWKDTFQDVTAVARQAFGIISELSAQSFTGQYEDLEKQKNAAILFAGDSATARAEIERQYEERKKKIQIKEAKAQKAQAIFEIAINTASAVVQALPKIPLAIIIGALGAAQLAMVAAQPIPAFWQGGEVGGMQQIMVNDDPYGKKGSNYKEVIEKPNGQILTPQGKNVKMRVPKGSFVHPTYDAFVNSLDSELLNNNIMPIGANSIMPMIINNGLTKGEIMDVMDSHASRLVSTINGQHGVNISIDENGINKYIKKKGGTSKIMNARYSGRGISV